MHYNDHRGSVPPPWNHSITSSPPPWKYPTTTGASHHHESIPPPDRLTTRVSHHHHSFVGCSCSAKLSSDHRNWVVSTQARVPQAPQRPIWTHFLPVWALLAQNRLCGVCSAALRQGDLEGKREGVCTC